MALTPHTRRFIEAVTAATPEIGPGADPAELRAAREQRTPIEGPEIARVRDLAAPGPAGDIPLRQYRPDPADPSAPGIVFFHGGGFVLGDLATHDHICRILAASAGAVVVAVDYRLAPEHRYPAAVDDAFAAARWTADNAADLGIDPARLAVAGDSAGGNLAAVVTQKARDEGGPALCYQALIYPVTDFTGYGSGAPYPSRAENGDGYFLTSTAMAWFNDQYLSDGQEREPGASPLFADSFADLPPALVLTADFDPLRDEGEEYARRLAGAGVPTATLRVNDGFHGLFGFGQFLPSAKRAEEAVAAALRDAFATVEGDRER
ncbi:alpha/beta hydrolase [Nocardiopsis suaedae]|uniref:Alpha/beta hydrolase n=1 Tax=Nocardiopsis suaedae TaxID=3018444 RepID=A0ABT4TM75_9ACTN|nr:alpha/beta hydrolase [Nocardiopsis suaedae]MDA2805792.1 alpha/beta hydrolase [Nocardiopsis suaedae]